jgi:hypothetical protein
MEFDDGYQSYDYSQAPAVEGQVGVSYTPQMEASYDQTYTPRAQTYVSGDVGATSSPTPLDPNVGLNEVFRDSPDLVAKLANRGQRWDEATQSVVPLGPTGADYQRLSESIDPTQLEDKRGTLDRLAQALGTNKKSLLTAGVAGLGGLLQSRQAAAQGQGAKKELSALAAPYRQRGQELLTAAERGELNPVGQQQLQAMQARLAQGVEQRGGVGAQQAQAQINAYRDQLIQSQYDLGLKVLNIADNISAGAIKTGLAADQFVNELTNNYMNNIARNLAGQPSQQMQTQTG